jgi:hypothetical protein
MEVPCRQHESVPYTCVCGWAVPIPSRKIKRALDPSEQSDSASKHSYNAATVVVAVAHALIGIAMH